MNSFYVLSVKNLFENNTCSCKFRFLPTAFQLKGLLNFLNSTVFLKNKTLFFKLQQKLYVYLKT
jgi:hypothetical protein